MVELTKKLNEYARALRDSADKDYISARMTYKAGLLPQFQWSALHALEKYGKCILLLNRIPQPKKDKIGHEVNKSLNLIPVELRINLSNSTTRFINKLESYGAQDRYSLTVLAQT